MAVVEADSTWLRPVKGGRPWTLAPWREAFEIESRRVMVWAPLLLVLGIWSYFALQREPPAFLGWMLLPCGLALLLWPRTALSLRILSLLLVGFAVAQLRTAWVATPVLRAFAPQQTITGLVADVDVRSRQRFSMVVEIMEAPSLPQSERPKRVLVQVTGKQVVPQVGNRVRLTADLAPLPRPSQPGSFDYGRQLYFQSIGAVGRSKTPLSIVEASPTSGFLIRRAFHDIRSGIGARVRDAIPGPLGSFADALITGERATIPRDMNESLQNSGLFHILSISGLHMALVAGGAFWALRALFALSPALALRWPIKKWAAAFAIFVGALYMLLADSGAATERSFIMIAIVFFAVLVDRPAMSMHNLALAAVVILLWSPEQALAASFQMSFMAVMGLAAFFHWWQRVMPEPVRQQNLHWVWRWGRRAMFIVAASLATSLVAGLLSGIPAAHHFGRVAPYGVAANALALPIVSVVVMPTAMASVLVMPFGLEAVPLKFMGYGLQAVMVVSDWVSSWPGAGYRLPLLDIHVAAALSLALAFALLPASRIRLLAVPLVLVALVMHFVVVASPLVLVDERAGTVALAGQEGLVPALPSRASASVSRWLQRAGDGAAVKMAAQRKGWACTAQMCEGQTGSYRVAYILKSALAQTTCPKADVVVAQEPLRRRCKGSLATIDRFDVWRNGAYAVYADGRVEHVRGVQGQRPWVYEPRARNKP